MGNWLSLLVAVLCVVWTNWTAYQHGLDVADGVWQARWEQQMAEQSARLAAANQQVRDVEQAKIKAISEIEGRYAQELNDAQAANVRLRDAVDAGDKRLRIFARRPASCPAVPGTTDGAELDSGAAVELAPAARRAYFRLRDGITRDTSKLMACQQLLRELTVRP